MDGTVQLRRAERVASRDNAYHPSVQPNSAGLTSRTSIIREVRCELSEEVRGRLADIMFKRLHKRRLVTLFQSTNNPGVIVESLP